jgi:hypothetical protein
VSLVRPEERPGRREIAVETKGEDAEEGPGEGAVMLLLIV